MLGALRDMGEERTEGEKSSRWLWEFGIVSISHRHDNNQHVTMWSTSENQTGFTITLRLFTSRLTFTYTLILWSGPFGGHSCICLKLANRPLSRRHGWVELTNHTRSRDIILPCHWSTLPIHDAEIRVYWFYFTAQSRERTFVTGYLYTRVPLFPDFGPFVPGFVDGLLGPRSIWSLN